MKPWLYVGAKVTPVRFRSGLAPGEPKLMRGGVYTVSEVLELPHWDEPGIRVAETAMPAWLYYYASAFKPVSTIDTTRQVEDLKKLMLKGRVEA